MSNLNFITEDGNDGTKYPETVVIRHMPKYINPCEGRGRTDESSVMGVEE